MTPRRLLGAALAAGCILISSAALRAQQVNPPVTPAPSARGLATPMPSPAPSPTVTPSPTPAPITAAPQAAQVPVGASQVVRVGSAVSPLSVTVTPGGVVTASVDQAAQSVTLSALAPGSANLTITDQRGVSVNVPVRAAFLAGTLGTAANIRITGDPAAPVFIKQEALRAALGTVQARAGAQIVASTDQIMYRKPLAPDNLATVDVPVLLQGQEFFPVDGVVHVQVENLAAPKITPDSLMVSDYPEKLTANGLLFAADLKHAQPSRFLYFHYNPPGEPDRRIVLRAQNLTGEPAVVQFIGGEGGPDPNEMAAGHVATYEFLKHLAQNEGRVIVIPANGTVNLSEQALPAKAVACTLLQLRVLNGGTVHLTLFAQNAASDPAEPLANETLLAGDHPHARGIYRIPEFHYSRLWNVNAEFLELPIGQIPLQNELQGEALAGDYGVLQSFVIKVENPNAQPVPVAIYENPRGGRATGSYLIDGILIQSHQVPAFSRYKVRQYVVPARGFVRVTIETIPDSGSSYPLRLVFAPDDGSVPPGAPGSPIF